MGRARLQELILPLAVVLIVGMMIFPLPAEVLDVLLAANLSFSLLLLFTSISTCDPERFTVLPSLLLLSTLFRLGLNVSTTRQLLSYGEAPEIVRAFGEFVVGGNVLAGCVVFLIVTLVQFIVVSKGAERVAEVAARFTLDAMPGKQIAIDADIRSGLLSLPEARARRRELQRESKLFGALDGAMKFIKGDAIAGLCIAVLNIAAGFFAGVFQLGLSLRESLDRYTLFTIGDSLVSQVPALLVSVAAGIAVTRVGESEGVSMASELASQVGSEPRILLGTSALLGILACTPGLPGLPFLALAAAGVALAFQRRGEVARERRQTVQPAFQPRATPPLLLAFSPRGRNLMLATGALPRLISDARQEIFEELGVLVPEPEWIERPENEQAWVGVELDGLLIAERQLSSGGATETPAEEVKDVFLEACRSHLELLVDDTQTRTLLELHAATIEDLVTSMVPKLVSVTTLTRLLRDLVAELVSVRSMKSVLQGIAEHCLVEGALEYPLSEVKYLGLLANVRVFLRRQIAASLPRSAGQVDVWELSSDVGDVLERAVLAGCPIDPGLADNLLQTVSELPGPAVLLCSRGSRKLVANVLRSAGCTAFVLSPEELVDERDVGILGQILAPASLQRAEEQLAA